MRQLVILFLILAASTASAFVDLPEGCWMKASDASACAVRAAKREWLNSPEGTRVLLGAGSSVVRSKAGEEWSLVEGQVWLETEKPVQVRHLQRTFQVQGESWWVRSAGHVQVQVFRGSVATEFGSGQELVPAGFENWWESGTRGVLKPVQADKVLRDWNRWVRLPKVESMKRLEEYRRLWASRVEDGSGLYQDIISRRNASVEEKELAAENRRRRAADEQRKMRRMFRDRFDNP